MDCKLVMPSSFQDPVAVADAIFVGREAELWLLRGALADARAGRGSFRLLIGELAAPKSAADHFLYDQPVRGGAVVDDRIHGDGRYLPPSSRALSTRLGGAGEPRLQKGCRSDGLRVIAVFASRRRPSRIAAERVVSGACRRRVRYVAFCQFAR
jgi:hypothetical protein